MPVAAQSLLEQALKLSPSDRAMLADRLLASLEPTDPDIDALRTKDARERLAAYEAGELEAIPIEDLFMETDEP